MGRQVAIPEGVSSVITAFQLLVFYLVRGFPCKIDRVVDHPKNRL